MERQQPRGTPEFFHDSFDLEVEGLCDDDEEDDNPPLLVECSISDLANFEIIESMSNLILSDSSIYHQSNSSFSFNSSSSTLAISNVTRTTSRPRTCLKYAPPRSEEDEDFIRSSPELSELDHTCHKSRWEAVQEAPSNMKARLPVRLPSRTNSPGQRGNHGAPKKPTRSLSSLQRAPRPLMNRNGSRMMPTFPRMEYSLSA